MKKKRFGGYGVYTRGGAQSIKRDPVDYAVELEGRGTGEILLTSIDRDGTMDGYDLFPTRDALEEVLDERSVLLDCDDAL